jgi:perosamine synthetase
LRSHGASVSERERHEGAHPYLMADFDCLGFNYRMTDLQGAVGLVQLQKLDHFLEERSRGAAFYRRELSKLGWLDLPTEPNHGRHAWQAFVTYVHPDKAPRSRDQIMDYLQQHGIGTRPGTHALHMLGYYRDRLQLKPEDFPAARDCAEQSMAIPLHNRMTKDDYTYVVDVLRQI